MADATTANQVDGYGFAVNLTSDDASAAKTAVAAVAGKSHYIKKITIACVSAISVTIQDNTGTPVLILGPITFTTGSSPFEIEYLNGIQVAAGKTVDVIASGAGAVAVNIQGYTE